MYLAFSVQSVSEDIHRPSEGILFIAVFQLKRKMKNDKVRNSYFVNPNTAVDLSNHHKWLLTSQRVHLYGKVHHHLKLWYSCLKLQVESIKLQALTQNLQETEEQRNMLNDATGIQSAKSRTQERLQTKQVVFQQINHKRGKD